MNDDFKTIAEIAEETAKKYGLDYVTFTLMDGIISIAGHKGNKKKVDLFKSSRVYRHVGGVHKWKLISHL